MASLQLHKTTTILLFFILTSLSPSYGSRKLSSLYQPPPIVLSYHNGALLEGQVPISILWYGNFTLSQRSIITDFIHSLTPPYHPIIFRDTNPTVSKWWKTINYYIQKAGKSKTHVLLTNQIFDDYSMGPILSGSKLKALARSLGVMRGGVAVVLTADDVAVEGFCSATCGLHSSIKLGSSQDLNPRSAYIWVGNPMRQCPGQCAWPFYPPIYGPQAHPLVSPNNDIGLDGMVITLSNLLAGSVTNPFGGGYFQSESGAPVEVAAACPGVYASGAYPGYAGKLKVDAKTKGSYNVEGVKGRKFVVPTLVEPITKSCLPMA